MVKKDCAQTLDDLRSRADAARNDALIKEAKKLGFDVVGEYIAEVLTEIGYAVESEPKFSTYPKYDANRFTVKREQMVIMITARLGDSAQRGVGELVRSIQSLRFVKTVTSWNIDKSGKHLHWYFYMGNRAPGWILDKPNRPTAASTAALLRKRTIMRLLASARDDRKRSAQFLKSAEESLALCKYLDKS